MKSRRLILRSLLAFPLLVSQQLALAHAVSHLSSHHGEATGKQIAAEQFCDHCLSAAQLGTAGVDSIAATHADACPSIAAVPYAATGFVADTALAFRSRAPPLP